MRSLNKDQHDWLTTSERKEESSAINGNPRNKCMPSILEV